MGKLKPTRSARPEGQQPEARKAESGDGILGKRQLACSPLATESEQRGRKLLSGVRDGVPEAKRFYFFLIFSVLRMASPVPFSGHYNYELRFGANL